MTNDELLISHIRYTSQDVDGRRCSVRAWPYLLIIGFAAGVLMGAFLP